MVLVSLRGIAAGEPPAADEVRAALDRAVTYFNSISTAGGYLWEYSSDLTERFGEEPATSSQIWVQPPGTPSVGQALLLAYAATGNQSHLEAARAAALALTHGQLESGGWDYLIEFDPAKRSQWCYRDEVGTAAFSDDERTNVSNYDDDNTQSVLRFFLAFVDAARSAPSPRDEAIRDALEYGLKKLQEAQFANGAWSQRWDGRPHDPARYPILPASLPENYPREFPSPDYFDFYTFNDNTIRDALMLMLDARRRTGRVEFRESARRAADFIVLAQLPEPQPGWAQQYDAAMHPAWARAFEPPAVSSFESAGVVRLLLDLHREFSDPRFMEAAGRAVAWFRRSAIRENRWARYYELHTNRPIYGDWDGRIHYTLAELSAERQTGYYWEEAFGIADTIAAYEAAVAASSDAAGAEPWTPKDRPKTEHGIESIDEDQLAARARDALDAMDSAGRWLEPDGGRFTTERFIANVQLLSEFLIRTQNPRPKPSTE
ncbi:pectate lyase [Synoicihabitans lomoniglobus]|uniref:Pectate lyase n=2 Tax=Synoicihabitans lomoniglobus TaxID=2909285 RepID=A0AAF0CMW7_9BACT|nr:pectate lyase [Opitutaceae bacterium LMO-M01]